MSFIGLDENLHAELFNIIVTRYLPTIYSFCFVQKGRVDDAVLGSSFLFPFTTVNLQTVPESIQLNNLEQGCQAYILSGHSAVDFFTSYQTLQGHSNQRFPDKSFIVVLEHDVQLSQLQAIVGHRIMRDIPRLLILNPFRKRKYIELWTNRFAGMDGHKELLLLDTYFTANRSFKHDANLFPDKMLNLDGRFVRLALINYEPYTTWIEVHDESKANAFANGTKKLLVDGTETRMLLEFCRVYNCSLDISLEEADQWGDVYENQSGTGIMGAISEHRVDIGIGAMLAWFYDSNSPTQPLSKTGVTCITPKQRLLPSWMVPILPFSMYVWIAVFATFFFASIALFSLNYLVINVVLKSRDTVDICEVFISVGSSLILCSIQRMKQYKLGSQLAVVTILLFAGLIIGNSYTGGMSSIMTVPQYEKPIDTATDLSERSLKWGASHEAWVYALEDTDEPVMIKLVSSFITMEKPDLYEHAKRSDMAYAIERLQYGHYAISNYITRDVADNFQVMIEDLYWGHCVAQVTKTWPMLNHLDDLILRVSQSGIQRYWEEKVLAAFPDAYHVQKIIGLARVQDNPEAKPLHVFHVAGPFLMLLFGLTAGVVAFVFEIVCPTLLNRQSSNHFALRN